MAVECVSKLSRLFVPNFRRLIVAGRNNPSAVWGVWGDCQEIMSLLWPFRTNGLLSTCESHMRMSNLVPAISR